MNGFRGTGYCTTGRWFRRGTDTQGVVRGNDSSRRKKEFDVGCRFRDKDWGESAVGFVV